MENIKAWIRTSIHAKILKIIPYSPLGHLPCTSPTFQHHTASNNDMIQSMMAHYSQSAMHMLPVWSHYANENWCMIGYHSVSVIADAIMKETYKGDPNVVLYGMCDHSKKQEV